MAMGYFKNQNLIMNTILIFLFLLIGCTKDLKKESNLKLNKSMEINDSLQIKKFDIEKFESNLKKNPSYEGYQKNKETYIKQFYTIKSGYIEDSYTRNLVENYIEQYITNDRFNTFYKYDKSGELQFVSYYFGKNLEIGEWITYENGKIIKKEDKEEKYSFKFNQVLKYCKDKGMNLLKKGEVLKTKDGQKYTWEITWNTGKVAEDGESYLFKKIILDGNTGKEISIKEYTFNPLGR